MGSSISFSGVILAAGESSRMGRDKALLPWPPQSAGTSTGNTFLSAAIGLFTPYVDVILVVTGKNVNELSPIVYARGASLLVNPDPSRGQFSSLQTGLREVLNRGRDAAMVTLVDRPPVRFETVGILQEEFGQALKRGMWAVVPEYQGARTPDSGGTRDDRSIFASSRDRQCARNRACAPGQDCLCDRE